MGATESTPASIKISSPCLSFKRKVQTKIVGGKSDCQQQQQEAKKQKHVNKKAKGVKAGSWSTATEDSDDEYETSVTMLHQQHRPLAATRFERARHLRRGLIHRSTSCRSRPPEFTERQRELVKGSWEAVENHISQVRNLCSPPDVL
jgi:hypothetical protein